MVPADDRQRPGQAGTIWMISAPRVSASSSAWNSDSDNRPGFFQQLVVDCDFPDVVSAGPPRGRIVAGRRDSQFFRQERRIRADRCVWSPV